MGSLLQASPPGRVRRHRRRRRGRGRRQIEPEAVVAVPPSSRGGIKEASAFFLSFLRRPGTIGSLVPSSESLALSLIQGCNLEKARSVAELGPGTGAITRSILERLGPQTLFLALELEREHVKSLRLRFPRLRVYHDSAAELKRYLGRFQLSQADVIVSSLPWVSMTPEQQLQTFSAVAACVASTGTFVTFGYLHAWWLPRARAFRCLVGKHFGRVEVSPVVWRNFPPALILRCREPRAS